MKTLRFAAVAASLLLSACASRSAVTDQFRDHVERHYRPSQIEVVGMVDYRADDGSRRCHGAAAVPDDIDGWRLVWTDFGRAGRSKWMATDWPLDPYPRYATLANAKAAGSAYLRRFKDGNGEPGRIAER